MNDALVTALLEPIPGNDIGGIDLSFSPVLDQIREARRADDASLSQGDWQTALKAAQWPLVRELTEEILRHQSKDLQVAAWYVEAMARLEGFEGLAAGLQLIDGLLSDFWEFCYPPLDHDDFDERAGKIEWLNRQLPRVVGEIPLTDRGSGAYSWLKWEESRATENLGLKDPSARESAAAAGKLTGEAFDKAAQASGRRHFETLGAQIRAAVSACAVLEKRVDERFGRDAPSLKETREALQACDELVSRLLARLGGRVQEVGVCPPTPTPLARRTVSTTGPATPPSGSPAPGAIADRNQAIALLREVAAYFRRNEPHSPVALLAERAAHWAEMPIDEWLASVVKDQNTLGQLRELLDIRDAKPSQAN